MGGDADVGILPTVLQSGQHAGAGAGDRLLPGAHAGDYVIDRRLGGGGMGEVYAGHHPVIGKKVAVKVIRSQLAASPEAVARFTREARAVNQVDHANVVDVFALGRLDDGRLFLVMDLVEGESLRARLAAGRFSPAETLAVIEPIAAALDAAHARGVVHRDLKPDNVMVSGPPDRPVIKVLDFGIAKLVSSVATDDAKAAVATATLTGQGTWLGTPAYMAPEQWSADGAVPASDRYAFTAMTYELLTGAPPFAAGSVPAMMEQHFRAEVPTVTGSGTSLPAAVDEVLRRGLAKDPARRHGSAAELVTALREAIGTHAGSVRVVAPVATAAGGGPRRTHALPVIAGVLGVGVMAIGVWVVSRDRDAGKASAAGQGAATGPTAQVLSTPAGATVLVGGVEAGVTPRTIDVAGGGAAEVEVRKPGYLPQKRSVTAGAVLNLALQPVDGFQGTWSLPSGELRRFVRQGEAVVALRLAAAADNGTYYRRFEFVTSTGSTVSFAAEEDHVDPRAPDEVTCHVALKAQYDYDPGGDELELRKERVRLDYAGGRCVVAEQGWGPAQVLTRIDRAADTGTWAESRAGGGGGGVSGDGADNPAIADNPGLEPKEPLIDDTAGNAEPDPVTSAVKPPVVKGKGKGKRNKVVPPTTSNSTGADLKAAEQQKLQQQSPNNKANLKANAAPNLDESQARNPAPTPQAQEQPGSRIAPPPQATGGKAEPEGAVQLQQQQKITPGQKK